jgi:hypothetical protein
MARATNSPQVNTVHRAVIQSLVDELKMPNDEVENVYLEHVGKLESRARVLSFVSVLAAHDAKAELRTRRRTAA